MNNPNIDTEVLASRFTLKELRKELHHAEVNCLPDQDDWGYWCWYADVIRGAIVIKRANQPVTPVSGHIDLEAVWEHGDIVALAEGYSIRLLKTGKNFKAQCPFHKDKSPSFYLYPEENRFHCYGCQADGDLISFVMKIENCDFKTAAIKAGGVL